ncbi:MAG: fibronectin type III domain-containing protein [Desulfuromusa sp.]|nr:fibronectin type III domain-containing protein [Desulfuromusa sp.]
MKLFQILIISFLTLVNSITLGFAQDITLSWDSSPTREVVGYKVHYQQGNKNYPFTGSGAYEGDSPVDVGDVLSTTLTNLSEDATYFFTVTAYDHSEYESSYSNIVSNGWIPVPITPTASATNEPVPVTFHWETAPDRYDVTYTLYYGTDQEQLTTAAASVALPPVSRNNNIPAAAIVTLIALLLISTTYRPISQLKFRQQIISVVIIALLGGILTACGNSNDSTSSSDHSATKSAPEAALYSINVEDDDYHQAYDLEASTTYFWKVVATDTTNPDLTYESEVRHFTTEEF